VLSRYGSKLDPEQYFATLAGRSSRSIISAWLGDDHPLSETVLAIRRRRYRQMTEDGSSVPVSTRAAVELAAKHVPVGVVSGAERGEVELVLEGSGLANAVTAVVSLEDVKHEKPSPEGYQLALRLLGCTERPEEVLAFEDTEIGIAAAKAAGIKCIGVLGTRPRELLASADEVIPIVDAETMGRLLMR
jgi:sugar-phosphatase